MLSGRVKYSSYGQQLHTEAFDLPQGSRGLLPRGRPETGDPKRSEIALQGRDLRLHLVGHPVRQTPTVGRMRSSLSSVWLTRPKSERPPHQNPVNQFANPPNARSSRAQIYETDRRIGGQDKGGHGQKELAHASKGTQLPVGSFLLSQPTLKTKTKASSPAINPGCTLPPLLLPFLRAWRRGRLDNP